MAVAIPVSSDERVASGSTKGSEVPADTIGSCTVTLSDILLIPKVGGKRTRSAATPAILPAQTSASALAYDEPPWLRVLNGPLQQLKQFDAGSRRASCRLTPRHLHTSPRLPWGNGCI